MSETITVSDIEKQLHAWADPELAEDWDNVGLLLGDPATPVKRALLCLDADREAIARATKKQAQLLICHHPLIFAPLSQLRRDIPGQDRVMEVLQHDLSLIAAHTNLDAAEGGVADALTQRLAEGMQKDALERQNLTPASRWLSWDQATPLSSWLERCQKLPGAVARTSLPGTHAVRRVAFAPGALSEEVVEAALHAGTDLVVCGEAKHHLIVLLRDANVACCDVGHAASEAVVLEPLCQKFRAHFPDVEFAVDPGMTYNESAH